MTGLYRHSKEAPFGEGDSVQEREKDKIRQLDILDQSGGWCAESKRDGIWCSIEITSDRQVIILSRTDQRKSLPELEEVIKASFIPNDTILLGELGYGSQESSEERARIGHDFVDLFDILRLNGQNISCYSLAYRRGLLEGFLKASTKDWIRLTKQVRSGFAAVYLKEDEGLMLKRLQERYDESTWWKVKKQHTVDYIIMGWEESTAETKVGKKMAARLICGAYVGGDLKSLVKVAVARHSWCKDVAENFETKYHGKVVELACFKVFKSGSLRHPSICVGDNGEMKFRDDKKPESCVVEAS